LVSSTISCGKRPAQVRIEFASTFRNRETFKKRGRAALSGEGVGEEDCAPGTMANSFETLTALLDQPLTIIDTNSRINREMWS
jgi:hypothetical protein